jgi:hypothetical protein
MDGESVKVKVWSAMPVNAADIEKIRYIMKNSTNRNRDLSNAFPHRFKRRQGNDIFFDAGKRRYCQEV